ncbi:DNA helicase-2/ATP-dependent DNA helicase PcrA [Arcanobacterium pluranimalium]|uniref:UvrD-helicase domain-containing protein n=1 Tax=Arcanobacterium pluranimalium TaxID=108028 RepID=UPI00195A390B|nr:UvrD-helicase domain-containing protein [Arcanobacterium pluranimalium]MBM7825034.1 DNA helicase-2/ATP-dependent DNA helicase PcrA [Arcanobacterium pluranimalium]
MNASQNSQDAFSAAMERLRARVAAAQETAGSSSPSDLAREPAQATHRGVGANGVGQNHGRDDRDGSAAGAHLSTAQQAYLDSMLAGLNPRQREAVVHRGGHLLVIAGAGSGKTRVLTTRISYLIATRQVQAGEILAITFTNKAAKEMRERLETMLGPVAQRMWISTFHSACVRILRAEHKAIGMRSTFTIYDAADSQRLMKMICAEENIDSKQFPPKTLSHKVSDLKNEMIDPHEFARQAVDKEELVLAQAYMAYQQRLRAAHAMDFDDLIMQTVVLLRENPLIAEHYRRRFRHVLIDEYQDTNTAQYQLVRALVGEEDEAVHGELTVVGDADQSIYAFRGATIRNIESFEEDFPNATTILLEQNYRSTQNILTAANSVIAHNESRRVKKLWTDSGDGHKLVGYVADAESDEASFVIDEIDRLHDRGYKYSDMAVFYRANAQSRSIEDFLVRSGIPYRVVGGTKFYDRKEIKDAVAYLQAIVNPDDTVSLRRVINEPKRGIGAKAQDMVAFHANRWHISFGAALGDIVHPDPQRGEVSGLTPRARNAMSTFVTMLEQLREKAVAGAAPADILDEVMDASGYLEALQTSADPQDEVRLENLAELHSVASDFRVLNPDGTLGDFLDQISLVADSDQLPDGGGESEGEVVLMTIHTAKGLEFPVVFVTGMEDGTFPHIRSLGSSLELAEERRLAYVALTRARERLYISRAATRSQWGAPQELPPSRFLEEIPASVIEWKRETSSIESLRGSGYGSWGIRSAGGYGSGSGSGYGRGRSTRFFDDDDFAPPVGSGKFVPGKLGEEIDIHAAQKDREAELETGSGSASGQGAVQRGDESAAGSAGQTASVAVADTGGLSVGDKVRHKSFGEGVVVSFEGQGKSTVAKVKFKNGATKRLMLRFAPLEKC